MMRLSTWLAVAIFTGSLVSVHSDEQKSLFAQLEQDVEEYLRTVMTGIQTKVNWVMSSNTSQKLSNQLHRDSSKAVQYLYELREELPGRVTGFVDAVAKALMDALDAAGVAGSTVSRQMERPTEELYHRLEDVLAFYANPILEEKREETEALSARIQKASKKKEEELAKQLDGLKALEARLGPYVQRFLSRWQEFQMSLEPLAEWLLGKVRKGTEAMNKNNKPES